MSKLENSTVYVVDLINDVHVFDNFTNYIITIYSGLKTSETTKIHFAVKTRRK